MYRYDNYTDSFVRIDGEPNTGSTTVRVGVPLKEAVIIKKVELTDECIDKIADAVVRKLTDRKDEPHIVGKHADAIIIDDSRLTAKCLNCANGGSYKCSKCDGEMYFSEMYFKDEPQTDYDKGLQLFADILFDKEKSEQFLKECKAMGIEPQSDNIKVTCDMVGNKKEIEYQLPKCEKCINYGVEFTEDDSIDTCLIDECQYEPKDEPQTDCPWK